MDAVEPHARRRGMFSQIETSELDDIETESAEGIPARIARPKSTRKIRMTAAHAQLKLSPTHQSPTPPIQRDSEYARGRAQLQLRSDNPVRFASATGSRPPSEMRR